VNLFNRQRLCSRQIQRLPINRPSTNTKKSGSYPVDGAKGALAEAIPQFDLVLHQVAVRLPAHVSVLARKSRGGGLQYRDMEGSVIALSGHGCGRGIAPCRFTETVSWRVL
jgi:hypothetical protein